MIEMSLSRLLQTLEDLVICSEDGLFVCPQPVNQAIKTKIAGRNIFAID